MVIIIFLLKREQIVQSYYNQLPTNNSTISLQNEGSGTFSSFTIGFWLYHAPPFIISSNTWTELFRLSSSPEDCGTFVLKRYN